MTRFALLCVALCLLAAGDVSAQIAGWCDCYGGFDETGSYWYLLDYQGAALEDSDWVYAAWTGPDEVIDPPDATGNTTGDDMMLLQTGDFITYGTFFNTVTLWPPGSGNHPTTGDLIYCRLFDAPRRFIGPGNYYSDSQTHQCVYRTPPEGDEFFALFPGDPGGGHTDTPVPGETSVPGASSATLLSEFALQQNYPNPFNPVTEITYALPWDVHATVKVYNVQGSQVATLVEADQRAGFYTIRWDAEGLSSGVYLCALFAGDNRQIIKMVLLK
jgi:hypothetical protein